MSSKRASGKQRKPTGAGKATTSVTAQAQERLEQIGRDLLTICGRLRELAAGLPSSAGRDQMLLGLVPRDVVTEIWSLADDLYRDELRRIVEQIALASQVTDDDLRQRFACEQAGLDLDGDSGEVLQRLHLPAANQPTLSDLANLFLALDEQHSPRAQGALLWLIHRDRQAARQLNKLVLWAHEAAEPGDTQAVSRPGWALGALATGRALDHLLANTDWDDPAAELDPAGEREHDLAAVLRACDSRLRRGAGDRARLRHVRQRLRDHLDQRRFAEATSGTAAEATASPR